MLNDQPEKKPKRRQSPAQLANLSLQPRCTGTKRDGGPCGASGSIRTDLGARCPHHSGLYTAEQKSEWARRGGLTTNHNVTMTRLARLQNQTGIVIPSLDNPKEVAAYLAQIMGETRAGILPPSQARVLTEMVGMRLKLAELEIAKALSDDLQLEDDE
jgi:hypothetical protein